MKTADMGAILDRALNLMLGSFLTLLFLTQFDRGDFSYEAGVVLLLALPLLAWSSWRQWKGPNEVTKRSSSTLSIHAIIAGMAFFAFSAMFIAKHAFGVEAIGYWTFLPLIVFFWANWSAGRELEARFD